jgi:23S rRNA (uracil1939-C5)-methyltransferase
VEKLVYGGEGLGRIDGRVVFTPFVLPGERIRAQARHEKPGLVRAHALEVLDPAPQRVEPPCPYFFRCGGCHYQHAPYEYQLAFKRSILVEELRRLGKIEPPADIPIVAADPWAYRNRAQLHVDRDRLGYLESRSHTLVPIDHCPITSPRVSEAIRTLVSMQRDSRWPRFVRSIEIFSDEQQVQINVLDTERPVARRFFDWCVDLIPGVVTGALDYEGRFRVSSNSFFQVNRFLHDRLVESAIGDLSGDVAVDLYAGVGLFSLPLATRFRKVIAIESGGGAVRDLQFNAERVAAGNIRPLQRTAEEYLTTLNKVPDLLLLDPPRAGLGKQVVERLIALKPPRVVIVACDPATLARDLSVLLAGGFHIDAMTLVDLFPQTFHMETVVRLVSKPR